MITLSQLYPPDAEKVPEMRLVQAYKAFADGKAGLEDSQLILVDLAIISGFFAVPEPGISSEELQHHGGARRVFGRIVRMTEMPANELSELIAAVIEETRQKGL
jgi:hypothetical protein